MIIYNQQRKKEEIKMKKVIVKDVELDYTNLYEEPVIVVADVEIEIDDEGNKTVVSAIAKESNEVFGVEVGERFDPGHTVSADDLLGE
jgi:hypothetical protein